MARGSSSGWLLGMVLSLVLALVGCGSSPAASGRHVIGPASAKVYAVNAAFANSKKWTVEASRDRLV